MSLRESDRRTGTWTNSWEGIGWLEWKVCLLCYFIIEPRGGVVDTSAKMEGRNILENGYDALVEVYCALLLNRRGVGDMEPPTRALRTDLARVSRSPRGTFYPAMHDEHSISKIEQCDVQKSIARMGTAIFEVSRVVSGCLYSGR